AVFDRLCVILRQHDDARGLVQALSARLTWLESRGAADPGIVPILFERAQVRRAVGDIRGAADDLDRVLELAPSHREALRVQAEVHTSIGDAAAAAELWRRYLAVEREGRARSDAELVLSKLLAEDLGDVGGAIEQLEHVIAAAPSDLGHRERLVGLASHAQDWRRVTRELREIARLRATPGERARDELRLGQLLRDRLNDHAEAIAAFERGRQLDAINLELVRELAELSGAQQPARRTAVLERAVQDLRAAIADSPAVAPLYDRLASVFGWRGDRDGQWLALTVVEALATPTAEQQALLAAGRAAPPPAPSRQLLDADARAALQAPGSGGLLTELWRAASAAVHDSIGIDPARLGFHRGDRVALKALGKRFEPAAACLASLGVEDVEIYVSEVRPGQARAFSAGTPILCLGADVASGATPMARFLLGRASWQVADRTAALAELKDAEVAWYLVAALRASEVPVPPALAELCRGDDAAVAERTRLVTKHLARRDRKTIAGLAGRLAEVRDVPGWRSAVVSSGARAGLAFAGDLHVALEAIDVGRGGRTLATDPVGLDLAVWTVSAPYLSLRRRRGLTIDGAPAPGGAR
ncbi:MAG TPA: tetratricopeptide repeat protein, partial [Kofleriaceae bacterium]|nr:tetratricopeptide repeat protein [Kofleriaceae bacterium]